MPSTAASRSFPIGPPLSLSHAQCLYPAVASTQCVRPSGSQIVEQLFSIPTANMNPLKSSPPPKKVLSPAPRSRQPLNNPTQLPFTHPSR